MTVLTGWGSAAASVGMVSVVWNFSAKASFFYAPVPQIDSLLDVNRFPDIEHFAKGCVGGDFGYVNTRTSRNSKTQILRYAKTMTTYSEFCTQVPWISLGRRAPVSKRKAEYP